MSRNYFTWELLNGLGGDPAVLVSLAQRRQRLLFDMGDLSGVSTKLMHSISTVLVSHSHLDHFIGFDQWLRGNLSQGGRWRFYGPSGFAQQVMSKLRGYTWNLIKPQQLCFEVAEVSCLGDLQWFQLVNDDLFCPRPCHPPLDNGLGFQITAVPLDHGIDSVAYRLEHTPEWNLNTDALTELGLVPGPWVRELKDKLQARAKGRWEISGQSFDLEDLAERLLIPKPNHSLGYITDIAFHMENLKLLAELFKDFSGALICEASFRDHDRQKAVAKKHLSTRQAALIAALLRAERFEPFHFSRIYGVGLRDSYDQAQAFFQSFCQLEVCDIWALIHAELQLCNSLVLDKTV